MKTYYITGCAGFVGNALVKNLLNNTLEIYEVIGSDILSSKIKNERFIFYPIDLCDLNFQKYILERHRPDIVIHLASQAIVNLSVSATLSSNYLSTLSICEACKSTNTSLIVFTTDKVYGNCVLANENTPFEYPIKEPYQLSKVCVEYLLSYYGQFFPITILRFANIYGPGDHHWNRLIPGCIRDALNGRKRRLRSDGNSTRDFIYVGDVIRSVYSVMQALPDEFSFFNITSGDHFSVRDVVEKIQKWLPLNVSYRITTDNEIKHQSLNGNLFEEQFHFKSEVCFDEGLRRTILYLNEYFKSLWSEDSVKGYI